MRKRDKGHGFGLSFGHGYCGRGFDSNGSGGRIKTERNRQQSNTLGKFRFVVKF